MYLSITSPTPSSSSASPVPSISLSNGVSIPCIGLGMLFGKFTGDGFRGMLPELAHTAIQNALDAGYQHFDSAYCYRTDRVLGTALMPLFRDQKLKRENIFITAKVGHPLLSKNNNSVYLMESRTFDPRDYPANNEEIRKKILHDFNTILDDLSVGYTDLLLLHWPGAFDESDEKFASEHRFRVWKVFEELYKKKAVRAIGVSNFSKKHLEEFIQNKNIEIFPMLNQIECHPYCHDTALINYCKEKKMVIAAYAPFASGCFGIFQEPLLKNIAAKKNRSIPQIILRWHYQHSRIPLPKGLSDAEIKQNLSVFDAECELSAEEMKEIDSLHPEGTAAKRTCPDPNTIA